MVTFTITVLNQGSVNASGIELVDTIPNGLTLNDTDWTQSGAVATYTFGSIGAGASGSVDITFMVNGSVTGTITNIAEISNDNGNDGDSSPDTNMNNDCYAVDNSTTGIASGSTSCTPSSDEDDHDHAEITLSNPA